MKERVLAEAEYIIGHNATIRQTAAATGVSKSTVHGDMTEKLRKIDKELFQSVRRVLEHNLSVRHLRGGLATKLKYARRE